MIQLFDDLDDVGHSITEADFVWMMTVVMVVVRLLMVPPDWRRSMTLSTVFTANGNNITHNIIIMLTGFVVNKQGQGDPVLHSLNIHPLLIDKFRFFFNLKTHNIM